MQYNFNIITGVVSLRTIMSFFSGGEDIPPTGFVNEPSILIMFTQQLPTCAVQLILPTKYNEFAAFKSAMTTAFWIGNVLTGYLISLHHYIYP